jgi:hypothetical protein
MRVIRGLNALHRANRSVNSCNKPANPASSRTSPWAFAQPPQESSSSGCNTGGDRAVPPASASRRTDKQLLPFFHGLDHGIAAHTISVAFQYYVVRVERFMVSVIAHIPRRFLHLQFIRSHWFAQVLAPVWRGVSGFPASIREGRSARRPRRDFGLVLQHRLFKPIIYALLNAPLFVLR